MRPSQLHIVPDMAGELEGELSSLHLTDETLVEVILEGTVQLLVSHTVVVGELAPQLRDFRGLADLKLKLVVCPVKEIIVGGD